MPKVIVPTSNVLFVPRFTVEVSMPLAGLQVPTLTVPAVMKLVVEAKVTVSEPLAGIPTGPVPPVPRLAVTVPLPLL